MGVLSEVTWMGGVRARIWIHGTPLQYSCLEDPMDGGAWWAAVHGVAKSQARLSDITLTFHFHALEKEMAAHSSVLAWRIPGTGEPSGPPSMGSHRVGHDWSDLSAAVAAAYCDFTFYVDLYPLWTWFLTWGLSTLPYHWLTTLIASHLHTALRVEIMEQKSTNIISWNDVECPEKRGCFHVWNF